MVAAKVMWSVDEVVNFDQLRRFSEEVRARRFRWSPYTKHDHNSETPNYYWGADLLVSDGGQYGGLATQGQHEGILSGTEEWADGDVIADIWKSITGLFSECRFDVHGVFLNAQTYGQEGEIHLDCDRPHTGYTFVVFVNEEWRVEWQGETLFYDDERTGILGSVIPEPGRLVIFDGSVPHWGRAPSRLVQGPRITLAYHTTLAPGSAPVCATDLRTARHQLVSVFGR